MVGLAKARPNYNIILHEDLDMAYTGTSVCIGTGVDLNAVFRCNNSHFHPFQTGKVAYHHKLAGGKVETWRAYEVMKHPYIRPVTMTVW